METQNKHDLKKVVNESSNMNFFMEQEDDIYATLDDRDSLSQISSENINSFNKTVYIRNDEVKN